VKLAGYGVLEASGERDFLAIPAMSSECERVFSSAKQTTPESSKLSRDLL
jgi:hypothetical protein